MKNQHKEFRITKEIIDECLKDSIDKVEKSKNKPCCSPNK